MQITNAKSWLDSGALSRMYQSEKNLSYLAIRVCNHVEQDSQVGGIVKLLVSRWQSCILRMERLLLHLAIKVFPVCHHFCKAKQLQALTEAPFGW
jgi:hypothetical protein